MGGEEASLLLCSVFFHLARRTGIGETIPIPRDCHVTLGEAQDALSRDTIVRAGLAGSGLWRPTQSTVKKKTKYIRVFFAAVCFTEVPCRELGTSPVELSEIDPRGEALRFYLTCSPFFF